MYLALLTEIMGRLWLYQATLGILKAFVDSGVHEEGILIQGKDSHCSKLKKKESKTKNLEITKAVQV